MGPIGVRGVRVLGTPPPDLFFKCMFGILSSRAINWHSLRRNWLRWGVTLASQSCSVPNGMWAVMYAGAAAAPHAPQSSTQINKQAGQPDGCPAYIKFSSGTCKKNRAVCNNHVVECLSASGWCGRLAWRNTTPPSTRCSLSPSPLSSRGQQEVAAPLVSVTAMGTWGQN